MIRRSLALAVLLTLTAPMTIAAATPWVQYREAHRARLERGEPPAVPYLGAVTSQWIAARAEWSAKVALRTARAFHHWQEVRAAELAALAAASTVYSGPPGGSGGCNVPPPGLANCAEAIAAINAVFGNYAGEALAVASCESGYRVWATNGQYFGLFQMGSSERATYGGSSTDPTEQSQAAYAYFAATGFDWSPWSCRP